ncbi:MAG: hypothetical protein S4CHLAM7_02490 [Chlamydiae bacterium]|nr:hypothetical protein [Chlamydiota bacterium]
MHVTGSSGHYLSLQSSMDSSRYRPFRDPESPENVDIPAPPSQTNTPNPLTTEAPAPSELISFVERLPPEDKPKSINEKPNSPLEAPVCTEVKKTIAYPFTTSFLSLFSNPFGSSNDSKNSVSGGSIFSNSLRRLQSAASTFDTQYWSSIAALTLVTGVAAYIISDLVSLSFHKETSIPETALSLLDNRHLFYKIRPDENLFHPKSAIQKTIQLYSDSLNIQQQSTWSNTFSYLLGQAKPDTIVISHKNNPQVAMTCYRHSDFEAECSLNQPISHQQGKMLTSIKETIEALYISVEEKMDIQTSFWNSKKAQVTYQIDPKFNLPDLFSLIASPERLAAFKDEKGTYNFPTTFRNHAVLH